ncbi:hypothetical protein IFM89_006255 [Coptis chinensis]|uniref:40S ribosomal protein S25 n=1 Tax=Coptis chinensis TaxID=261450 RepID=A0A835IV03_9MAGN|nr:hypothetical protein IFM89_006255 [Coptis chinensis]
MIENGTKEGEGTTPSSKPAKSGGGKQKKKKWSKGKQKEKVNNMVLLDQASYDKLLSEVPKYKLITPSILSDRLRVNGSLARRAITYLMARGSIRMYRSICYTWPLAIWAMQRDLSAPKLFNEAIRGGSSSTATLHSPEE